MDICLLYVRRYQDCELMGSDRNYTRMGFICHPTFLYISALFLHRHKVEHWFPMPIAPLIRIVFKLNHLVHVIFNLIVVY